jgi:hypothetical protein
MSHSEIQCKHAQHPLSCFQCRMDIEAMTPTPAKFSINTNEKRGNRADRRAFELEMQKDQKRRTR